MKTRDELRSRVLVALDEMNEVLQAVRTRANEEDPMLIRVADCGGNGCSFAVKLFIDSICGRESGRFQNAWDEFLRDRRFAAEGYAAMFAGPDLDPQMLRRGDDGDDHDVPRLQRRD